MSVGEQGQAFGRYGAALRRGLSIVVPLVVVAFIVHKARGIDWASVMDAVGAFTARELAGGAALALAPLLACASLDLIGRRMVQTGLTTARTMILSFTGYFFSLNLGALVGGLAFRYRLYQPHGLGAADIARIIGYSVLTNWCGYLLLAGLILTFAPPALPGDWSVPGGSLRALGVLALLSSVAYGVACATLGGKSVRIRALTIKVPPPRVAIAQFVISVVNWAGIGALLTWFLPESIGWATVMPVVMVSAIAGIWSHVPGGLGVTEFVFVALLGALAPEGEILAAVLAFRVLYYIVPFIVAVGCYGLLELSHRRGAPADADGDAGDTPHVPERLRAPG